MKLLLTEVTLVVFGGALAILPPEQIGFTRGTITTAEISVWVKSFEAVAVPICLILMGLWSKKTSQASALVWGIWLASVSLWIGIHPERWYFGWKSAVVVSLGAVLALALVVFSSIRLSSKSG